MIHSSPTYYSEHEEWRDLSENFHRLDGPAYIHQNGHEEWHQHGKRHRLDGPAVIFPNGAQEWWQNDEKHRLDGPAISWPNGREEWFIHGIRHRLDGPALIWEDGDQWWWVNGEHITDDVLAWVADSKYSEWVEWTLLEKTMFALRFR